MSANIVSPKDFKPSTDLLFTKPKVNAAGGKSIGMLNSKTKRSIMISSPLMLNWGVSIFENANGNGSSYSFSLQFPREEFSNPETNDLLNMLKDLEDKIKDEAVKNSKEWFGKAQSREVVEAFWNPILKYSKDKVSGEPDLTRDPTIKVKLPVWDGEFKFELFDTTNQMLIPNSSESGPEAFISKGSNIACILQCGGIWFANGNFGVSWKLVQGVVKPTENLERGKCHINLSSGDREQIGNDQTEKFAEDQTKVESDEEEEVEEGEGDAASQEEAPQEETSDPEPVEAEAEEEEPAPAPKKKRVVKKKS
tara:strand:- start:5 stop:931 length:927 start_codon:yes stop_codon:yes gene_type:complete